MLPVGKKVNFDDMPQIGTLANISVGFLYFADFLLKGKVPKDPLSEPIKFDIFAIDPDIYEQPFHSLNFSFGYKINSYLTFNFKASNILDSVFKQTHDFKGTEYIFKQRSTGRDFSIGLKYSL